MKRGRRCGITALARCLAHGKAWHSKCLWSDIAVFGDRETPLLDLRIDLNEEPVAELLRLYEIFAPRVPYYELHRNSPRGLPRIDDWLKQQAAN